MIQQRPIPANFTADLFVFGSGCIWSRRFQVTLTKSFSRFISERIHLFQSVSLRFVTRIAGLPKMEGFLNLIRLFWGWVFSYISRIHTAYIGEDSSILGTWNVWWEIGYKVQLEFYETTKLEICVVIQANCCRIVYTSLYLVYTKKQMWYTCSLYYRDLDRSIYQSIWSILHVYIEKMPVQAVCIFTSICIIIVEAAKYITE